MTKEWKQVHLKEDADFQGNWDLVVPLVDAEHKGKFTHPHPPHVHEAF